MRQILKDDLFEYGFNLNHVDGLVTREFIKKFDYMGTSSAQPVWKLAQWCCRYNLAHGWEQVLSDGSYLIEDISKSVRVGRGKGIISLTLRASREYSRPRREGEDWPHLLIEQEFEDNVNINDVSSIKISMDFKLGMCKNCMKREQQTSIHTVQFSWIFAIADRNKDSKGYGDYVWLVLPLFDDRYDFSPPYMNQDGGKEECTHKFIFAPSNKLYLQEPIQINRETRFELDIKGYALDAISEAKKRGYLRNSSLKDMYLHNTNLGFEITGTYDAEVEIRNLKILVQEGKND